MMNSLYNISRTIVLHIYLQYQNQTVNKVFSFKGRYGQIFASLHVRPLTKTKGEKDNRKIFQWPFGMLAQVEYIK